MTMEQPAIRVLRRPTALLRWWVGELTALVPTAIRQRLSPASGTITLAVENDQIAPVAEAALQRARRGAAQICLRLPQEQGLRSEMRLPLAAEENLREVIAFELDRQTPFSLAAVFYAYRVAARDTACQRLDIDLTVVPRGVIETAIGAAAQLGVAVDRIEVAGGTRGEASGNLLPPEQRQSRWRRQRLPLVLTGLASLLAVAAVALPLVRAHLAADTITAEAAAARQDAGAALQLQKQLAQLTEETQFLVTRKQARPSLSEILAEVTRQLPDGAWLTQLDVVGDEIQVMGSAPSATALIESFGRSPLLAGAAFRSPVVRDARLDRETFHIAIRAVREKGR